MREIGAGLPRTGTMSVQAALNQLGFRCHHMQEVPRANGHRKAWEDFVHERAPMDWETLFRDYDATVDSPACFFYEELLHAYPYARVLLTVRDADRWYDSASVLLASVRPIRPLRYGMPRLPRFLRLLDGLIDRFELTPGDRKAAIAAFHGHNQAVQRGVPADRLLVFQVRDGWEPLGEFLGCAVPEVAFPHLNERAGVGQRLRRMFLPRLRRTAE